jgi:hypothetical protein
MRNTGATVAARATVIANPEGKLPIREVRSRDDGLARLVLRTWPDPPEPDDGLVLLMIALYADSEIVDPSIREISAHLPNMSDYRVVQAIDRLETNGFLEVAHGDQVERSRNSYTVVLKDSDTTQEE